MLTVHSVGLSEQAVPMRPKTSERVLGFGSPGVVPPLDRKLPSFHDFDNVRRFSALKLILVADLPILLYCLDPGKCILLRSVLLRLEIEHEHRPGLPLKLLQRRSTTSNLASMLSMGYHDANDNGLLEHGSLLLQFRLDSIDYFALATQLDLIRTLVAGTRAIMSADNDEPAYKVTSPLCLNGSAGPPQVVIRSRNF